MLLIVGRQLVLNWSVWEGGVIKVRERSLNSRNKNFKLKLKMWEGGRSV